MKQIICEYYNHQGDHICVMTDEHQEELWLINLSQRTSNQIIETWLLEYLLDDIDYEEDIVCGQGFYDNTIEYLSRYEEDEEALKQFKSASFIIK